MSTKKPKFDWNYKSDPASSSCRELAERGRQAVKAHTGNEPDSELATYIGDLIANLMHLCELEKINFTECVERAERHFNTERNEANVN